MLTQEQKSAVLQATQKASEQWKSAFNSGNAAGCAAQYEKNAVMLAKPFGTFTGTAEIQAFWQKLIDDGFSDVDYLKPRIEVIDETSAVLTSDWKMNNAKGVIHKELWVLQEDGTAKLREDDFEALGE
ncbi:MAG: nuclear transport factor 2 family protein [Cyanobacteria bacterium P01_A01_bin.123]